MIRTAGPDAVTAALELGEATFLLPWLGAEARYRLRLSCADDGHMLVTTSGLLL